ncbi:MAG: HAMP domain-containing protein, partial [Gammaproteobacteria bacterium]|nr:HAMP domain-containing protein [Gammaproteobacteria bacterium]
MGRIITNKMIGNRFSRFLLLATTLSVLVVGVVFAIFYGQYRWLAEEISATSSEEHYEVLQGTFERNAEWQLGLVSDALMTVVADGNGVDWPALLNRALVTNADLAGIRFTSAEQQSWESGSMPAAVSATGNTWTDERLVISMPIFKNGVEFGVLSASFLLDELRGELAAFEDELRLHELKSHGATYFWVGGGTLIVLLMCAGAVWLFLRDQSQRIRQLKTEAEKLRNADFGDRLPVAKHDELGALAAVFNDMRDRLRETTHSRDYVDSILSGMNEAIIVTSETGTIQRINNATTHLLGYEEAELVDTSIDFIVDASQSRSLADDAPSGLPKDSVFQSKFGDSIPVSYTCSIINGREGETRNRIYAAQNTT